MPSLFIYGAALQVKPSTVARFAFRMLKYGCAARRQIVTSFDDDIWPALQVVIASLRLSGIRLTHAAKLHLLDCGTIAPKLQIGDDAIPLGSLAKLFRKWRHMCSPP